MAVGTEAKEVKLFGSKARGDAAKHSDPAQNQSSCHEPPFGGWEVSARGWICKGAVASNNRLKQLIENSRKRRSQIV